MGTCGIFPKGWRNATDTPTFRSTRQRKHS
jgi:hypothetical protein